MKGSRVSLPAFLMVLAAFTALYLPFHPAWALLPLAGFFLHRRRPALGTPVLLFGCFLLLCMLRLTPPARDLRHVIPGPATVEMDIEVTGDALSSGDQLRVPVHISAVRYLPEFQSVTARAQLRLQGTPPAELLPGTRWRLHARIRPASLSHTGLRRADWLLLADAADLSPQPPAPTPLRFFFLARHQLSQRLRAATLSNPEAGDVLQALLLARRGDVDDEWNRAFARTGLLHIFAISGLHLGLLAAILLGLAKRFRVPYRYRVLCILPVLLLFTAATGFRASALRALIMTLCLVSAPLFYRRPHPVSAFSCAVLLLLGYAPEQLVDVGFQYSFLMVGGLLLFAKSFEQLAFLGISGDPWAPEEVRWPWWKRKLLRPLVSGLVVSTICFLISAPLTAYHFQLLSPVALIGNVLAVPLVFLLLCTGFPALLVLGLPAPLPAVLLFPVRFLAGLLLEWVRWLERLPGGIWRVPPPALWQLLAFYGLPALALLFPRRRRLCLAAGLTALGLSLTLWGQALTRSELVLLDADRGQALWLRHPGQGALLVDTGSDWSGRTVSNALIRSGVNRVEAVFLTHPARAHVEGIHAVREQHPPRRIYVAAPDVHHPLYEGLDATPLSAGDRLELAGWTVEVLWPPADLRARAAGMRSLVLRFTDHEAAILVMGGTDERVEAAILERGTVKPARILVAANTPRIPGGTPDFLRAVRPEAVLFSGRVFSGYSEARDLSEARASGVGLPVWRVPEGGQLRINPHRGTAEL